jgi:hypothetical protein
MITFAALLGQIADNAPSIPPVLPAQPQTGYWPYIWMWLPCVFGVAFYGLLAFCIYRAAKYFSTAGKEQKLIRMEMGKLAEEVRQMQ